MGIHNKDGSLPTWVHTLIICSMITLIGWGGNKMYDAMVKGQEEIKLAFNAHVKEQQLCEKEFAARQREDETKLSCLWEASAYAGVKK